MRKGVFVGIVSLNLIRVTPRSRPIDADGRDRRETIKRGRERVRGGELQYRRPLRHVLALASLVSTSPRFLLRILAFLLRFVDGAARDRLNAGESE